MMICKKFFLLFSICFFSAYSSELTLACEFIDNENTRVAMEMELKQEYTSEEARFFVTFLLHNNIKIEKGMFYSADNNQKNNTRAIIAQLDCPYCVQEGRLGWHLGLSSFWNHCVISHSAILKKVSVSCKS